VRPDPLVEAVDLPTRQGRIVVDEHLAVPGHDDIYAVGDVAAAPDPGRPGEITAMRAQHAQRQGRLAGLRSRVAADWLVDVAVGRQLVQFGFVSETAVPPTRIGSCEGWAVRVVDHREDGCPNLGRL
jgi:pyridine nucleotide-disulfide oxidoreductase